MKIIFILDQIQAGLGGTEKGDQPLGGKMMALGAAKMFEPHLKEVSGEIMATLYCGDEFYKQNVHDNSLKLVAMVKKLKPDAVICGPCFNYDVYGLMAAEVATLIETKLNIPAVPAMSVECNEAIEKYKDKVAIVKMSKKGGTGLTESIENILKLCQLKYLKEPLEAFEEVHCY